MRIALIVTASIVAATLYASTPRNPAAAAEGCTGPECSQPDQGGGHKCEHEKKEQITS